MTETQAAGDWLTTRVRDIPDFPRPGVTFKDLTPLFADPEGFCGVVDGIVEHFQAADVDRVIGIEARGFIVAAPVAYRFGAGFTPVRKAGKLPWSIEAERYALEYGSDELEIHTDAIEHGDRVLVVDDVLATGGTAAATVRLVERLGGQVVGLAFVLELAFLEGRANLAGRDILALATYR